MSSRSPRALGRSLDQLMTTAEERKAMKIREKNLRKLQMLVERAEASKREMTRRHGNKTVRRSFERYNANVPFSRRSRSRSRSSSRHHQPLEIIEVPAMSRRSSSSDDDELEPSGVYLSKWDFYNNKQPIYRGESPYKSTPATRQNAQDEISKLISNYRNQKKSK
jgi:hypothetical protein